MKYDEILSRVISLFSMYTDATDISAESEIMHDLEISSMEVLSLICNIEEEFGIIVSEKSIRKMFTISDVVDIIIASL